MNLKNIVLAAVLVAFAGGLAVQAEANTPRLDHIRHLDRHNVAGTSFAVMPPHANHFCYLSRVGVRETDTGTELFSAGEERDSSELGGSAGGYGHQATIPLESLSPGLYVLRVEARSRLKSDEIVRRDIPFRLRPVGTPRELQH